MKTRLTKLMCLCAALLVLVAGIAAVQAEDAPAGAYVSPFAGMYNYFLVRTGDPIYVGDTVDETEYTVHELETDKIVGREFYVLQIDGAGSGIYMKAGDVLAQVFEKNPGGGNAICNLYVTVLENEMKVESVAEVEYTGKAFKPEDFITAVTMNGEEYTDYTVECVSAEEIKDAGEYMLLVTPGNELLQVDPAQVVVKVTKATPVVEATESLLYTGEVLTDKDFNLTVTLGDLDVYGECTITPSAEIKLPGKYQFAVSSDNLNEVVVDVEVAEWAPVAVTAPADWKQYNDTEVYVAYAGRDFTITGEEGKTVVIKLNGEVVEGEFVIGDAAFTAALTVIEEGNLADRVQTLEVGYVDQAATADVENANAKVDFIVPMEDPTPSVAPLKDRDNKMTVTLVEPGFITSIVCGDRIICTETDEVSAMPLDAAFETERTIALTNLQNLNAGETTYTVTYVSALTGEEKTVDLVVDEKADADVYLEVGGVSNNVNERLNKGDLILTVNGYAGEEFEIWIGDNKLQDAVIGEDGTVEVTIDRSDLPYNVKTTVNVRYIHIAGSRDTAPFIVDDTCAKPIILTPVYENGYVIAGVVEVGSTVEISYPDYEDIDPVYIRPDAYGFFTAELDMLDAGDRVAIRVFDLGDNISKLELTAMAEDELTTQSAFPMGKLYTSNKNDHRDWLNITKVSIADLKEGVELPILANNCFVIGEFTAKMDEEGKVTYSYSIDDSLAALVGSYMSYSTSGADYDAFAAHSSKAVNADEAFEINENARYIWIYAEFEVDVDVDAMVETFQLETVRDSELKQAYTKLQRN